MSRPRRPLVHLLSVLITLSAAAGCTITETGTPSPAAGGGGAAAAQGDIPYDEETAPFVQEFTRVRTLDLCAVLDIDAAERVTRAPRTNLALFGGVNECQLQLISQDAWWRVSIGFGAPPFDGAPAEIAGTPVIRGRAESGTCEYNVPTAKTVVPGPVGEYERAIGYKFEMSYTGDNVDDAEACRTAQRYLSEVVLPGLKNPPTLADGRTTPRVPLLGKDPCAALAAGLTDVKDEPDALRHSRTFDLDGPYECAGGKGSTAFGYGVSFKLFSAVIDMQGQPIKVGDFTAYQVGAEDLGHNSGRCLLQIGVEPGMVFSKEEGTEYHGGIEIELPSCDEISVAEKVLANLIEQPDAPEPKPGAQLIGDLTSAR